MSNIPQTSIKELMNSLAYWNAATQIQNKYGTALQPGLLNSTAMISPTMIKKFMWPILLIG